MSTQNLREQRLGETRMMNCGLKAKIIKYITNTNIDVEFEDGYIAKHKCYDSFINGAINNKNFNRYSNRIGEKSFNKECSQYMEIIEYFNAKNVTIKYDNGCIIKNVSYNNFKKGNVRNLLYPKLANIGYIGYEEIENKSYNYWTKIFQRCYYDCALKRKNTYKDCYICKDWENYSNFKKWYNENYYEIDGEDMQLDKDILVKGNKYYSPNTCIFVPKRINLLFVKTDKVRGEYPIGVTKLPSGKFYSQCSYLDENNKISRIRKSYDNYLDAFNFYKETKEKYIKQVANEYNDKIPNKLYEALYSYEVEITD